MKYFILLYSLWLLAAAPAAQQTINTGIVADDGNGDGPRASFTKINSNFTELYAKPFSTITPGTGVATALGLAVNASGGLITSGGTPSAIGLSNGTGLPVSTGISGLGTGVAAALAIAPNAAGGFITPAGAATLTGKIMSGSSNTFTNLPAAGISGVIPIANLASGSATGAKFIRDDGTLAVPPGTGGFDAAANYTPTGTWNFSGATLTLPNFATITVTGNLGAATLSLGGVAITASGAEINNVDGTTGPIQTQLDAKADKAMAHKHSSSAYTIGTTDADELKAGTVYVTSTGTQSLPAIAVGMSVTIIADAAVVVTVDPNGSEIIRLNGVDLAAGYAVKSTGAIGQILVLTYHGAGKWYGASAEFITNGS